MPNRHLLQALTVSLLVVVAACGSDSPNDPGGGTPTGTLTLSRSSLDFGAVLDNDTSSEDITVSVPDDAAGPVSGEITLSSGSSSRFSITAGAGPFTLEPGEDHVFRVKFTPATGGTKSTGTVEFGIDDQEVTLAGFASAHPWTRIVPTGMRSITKSTNYKPFLDGEVPVVHEGTGRSYGADESWIDCATSGGWLFNGQGVTESKIGFGYTTPALATKVRVRMAAEVESDCTQVLIQIDGTEHMFENMAGCHTFDETYTADQARTDVYVGTDQQGLCGGDVHVRWIEITFGDTVISEEQWAY